MPAFKLFIPFVLPETVYIIFIIVLTSFPFLCASLVRRFSSHTIHRIISNCSNLYTYWTISWIKSGLHIDLHFIQEIKVAIESEQINTIRFDLLSSQKPQNHWQRFHRELIRFGPCNCGIYIYIYMTAFDERSAKHFPLKRVRDDVTATPQSEFCRPFNELNWPWKLAIFNISLRRLDTHGLISAAALKITSVHHL